MTDLVTRLRALAGETTTDGTVWYRDAVDALREAAAEIERLNSLMGEGFRGLVARAEMHATGHFKASEELDALKAKLDHVELERNCMEERLAEDQERLAEAEKRPTWAEWEALKAAHEQSWQEREARWVAKLAEAEQGRRVGWAEHWYQKYDEARAEAAALREAASCLERNLAPIERKMLGEETLRRFDELKQALSQSGPGAALLERVKKLEAVAKAARDASLVQVGVWQTNLDEALAALEEKP